MNHIAFRNYNGLCLESESLRLKLDKTEIKRRTTYTTSDNIKHLGTPLTTSFPGNPNQNNTQLMHAPVHDKFLKFAVEVVVPVGMMESFSSTF